MSSQGLVSCLVVDTTGGFSPKRFTDISFGVAGKDQSSRVMYNKVANPLALDHVLDVLTSGVAKWRCSAIVLDTVFGCIEQTIEDPVLRNVFWIQARDQLARLVLLATSSKILMVMLNTIGYKPGVDQERPTGEAIVRVFSPEEALGRPVIGPGGKTSPFAWLLCDDKTRASLEEPRLIDVITALIILAIVLLFLVWVVNNPIKVQQTVGKIYDTFIMRPKIIARIFTIQTFKALTSMARIFTGQISITRILKVQTSMAQTFTARISRDLTSKGLI